MMRPYPVPDNESERSAYLAKLEVDYENPEREILSLCTLASDIAGTPIALVSLVGDEEQRFAASIGMGDVTGTSRDVAFCAHAIMGDEMLVVPDARNDDRFCDNPLVTGGANIRAYAGSVLAPEDGMRVGTLCVIDQVPREFDTATLARLDQIGEAVSALLVAHRDNRSLVRMAVVQQQQAEALRYAAEHDYLTGALTRAAFWAQTELRLAQDPAGVLMVVDIDNFKSVNDRCGHPVGDAYIRCVVDGMRKVLPSETIIGRLGGDEFAAYVILKPDDGMDALDPYLEALREKVRQSTTPLGQHLPGSVSIGIACHPTDGSAGDLLYRRADVALYGAKSQGRDCARSYDASLDPAERLRVLRADFPVAVAEGRIVPFYQPLVDLGTGALYGYEALVRWDHAERGVLAPAAFWPLFEERDTAVAVSRTVAGAAIRDFATFSRCASGLERISINVTEFDLTAPDFADHIGWLLDDADLGWDRLIFEITENVVLERSGDRIINCLEQLRSRGAAIALDDFGTGHATLIHLKSWPIDILKIDKSFTATVSDDPRDAAIVASVIGLAHRLGVRVVCEGIETDEQHARVRELGCAYGQGYLFAVPRSRDDTLAALGAPLEADLRKQA